MLLFICVNIIFVVVYCVTNDVVCFYKIIDFWVVYCFANKCDSTYVKEIGLFLYSYGIACYEFRYVFANQFLPNIHTP